MPSVPINVNSNGDNIIVAAPPAGQTIEVWGWCVTINAAVNFQWMSGTTGIGSDVIKAGPYYGNAQGFGVQRQAVTPGEPLFRCAAGESLNLNLSSGVAVGGDLEYTIRGK
jgi:hypothetical protein